MDLSQIARVLGGFTVLFTAIQAIPTALAIGEVGDRGPDTLSGFVASMVTGLVVAFLLWLGGRRAEGHIHRRESIALAGLCWVLAGSLGAIPFLWSGLLPDPIDAIFESVSGLTTCGGTVLGTSGYPTPERTPDSLLLWRALLQWTGGLGIVLLFGLLFGAAAGGKRLLTAESVAIDTDPDQARPSSRARLIAVTYVALTAACAASLMLCGMSLFDAVCHAFTALATGGFSTRTSIAQFGSLSTEIVLTVFMFLGGCSFAAIAATARGGLRSADGLLRSAEFRIYSVVTAVAIGAVTLDLEGCGLPLTTALRQASFNVVSCLSCCGYATIDFQAWPAMALAVLLACMVIGGCSGSAAGGFKQVRLLVCLKLLGYTLRRFVRPRSVERLRLEGEVMAAEGISSVLAVTLLWILSVFAFAAIYAIDDRIGLVGALSASASMQANVGPAFATIDPSTAMAALADPAAASVTFGPNIGPYGGYGDLDDWTKLVMSLQMVLGRLELLTLLSLAMPSFWRR